MPVFFSLCEFKIFFNLCLFLSVSPKVKELKFTVTTNKKTEKQSFIFKKFKLQNIFNILLQKHIVADEFKYRCK